MEDFVFIYVGGRVLTKRLFVSLKIPAPPEAKLTPVLNGVVLIIFLNLDMRDKYGGEVGNPTFSAAQYFIYYIKFIISHKILYLHTIFFLIFFISLFDNTRLNLRLNGILLAGKASQKYSN